MITASTAGRFRLLKFTAGLLTTEPMKQLPSSIAEVEEGDAIFEDDEALILRNLEARQFRGRGSTDQENSGQQKRRAPLRRRDT
jgi:hypothetical protein